MWICNNQTSWGNNKIIGAGVKMRTVAYLRVSTIDQNTEKNKSAILFMANERKLGQVEFVEEKISGKISWKKRKVAQIISELKKGDNLIVSELSRLGRTMMDCMEILAIILRNEINLYVAKGNWEFTNTIQSKVIAMAFAVAAEIERELISQRTKEALQVAKMAGKRLGRPKGAQASKLDKVKSEIINLLSMGSTVTAIAKRYGMTPSAVFYWMKKRGIRRGEIETVKWLKREEEKEREKS